MTYSDATLLAYLDGALDEAAARALEAAVEADPALEQRMMALDMSGLAVRKVFMHLPGGERFSKMMDLPEPHALPQRAPRLILAAAVAAMAAFGVTFWATRPDPLNWQEKVAIYQALYVPETIATLDTTPAALEEQFARAEAKLGRPLDQAGLAALPELELKRAQILSVEGKPLIQIVFAGERGTPIAFCVIRRDRLGPDQGVTHETLSGLATAHWTSGDYGYMLVGGDDPDALALNIPLLTDMFRT